MCLSISPCVSSISCCSTTSIKDCFNLNSSSNNIKYCHIIITINTALISLSQSKAKCTIVSTSNCCDAKLEFSIKSISSNYKSSRRTCCDSSCNFNSIISCLIHSYIKPASCELRKDNSLSSLNVIFKTMPSQFHNISFTCSTTYNRSIIL